MNMKFKALFAFAISLLSLSSCMDNNFEIPPTNGGLIMYNQAVTYNGNALFFADLAFKVNILMEEAGDVNIDKNLKDVEIVIKKAVEDAPGIDASDAVLDNGFEVLFPTGSTTITRTGADSREWLVDLDNVSGYTGTLLVNMGDKSLNEDGAEWIITPGDDLKFSIDYAVSGDGMNIRVTNSGGGVIGYSISDNGSPYGLKISFNSVEHTATWSVNYFVEKSDQDCSYLGMKSATYDLTGESNGNTIYYGKRDITYTAGNHFEGTSLKYEYNSSRRAMQQFAGQETVVSFDLKNWDPSTFPDSKVNIIWSKKEGYSFYELNYNGAFISSAI